MRPWFDLTKVGPAGHSGGDLEAADPTIIHVDMDAFYASVEMRDDPALRGLPVCVGGDASQRGVIAAASYEARAFGVHSAMPTGQAKALCPGLVLLPANFEKYTAASRLIMGIFQRYTPVVEPLSLDEAFLDVAGSKRLFGSAVEIGKRIQADIMRETALVASVGIAPSKFLAKLASDLDKPNGFRVIQRSEIRAVLDPLPVSKIFGVGPRTAKRLESLGVRTVRELACLSAAEVRKRFGASGTWIHELAHGVDPRRVVPNRVEKSHGLERTFVEDIGDREELRLLLYGFCEEVSYDLRHRGLRGRTVTLKARSADFKTLTRSKSLDHPINVGKRIYSVARQLLERVPRGPLRLLGVQVSNLSDVRQPIQGGLFGSNENHGAEMSDARLERTTQAMDELRERFGAGTVVPASLIKRRPGDDDRHAGGASL